MESGEKQVGEEVIGSAPPVDMPATLESSAPDEVFVAALVTGGAAHELNNVLALLLMQVEVLGEEGQTEEARELLSGIRNGLQRGVGIAETLLRQSQATRGQRIPLNPKLLLTGIQKRSRTLLGDGVALTAHYPEGLPLVAVEPRVLFTVLIRLCRLALEATAGRALALRVECVEHPEAEDDGRPRQVALSLAARGWRVGETEGEVSEAHPVLGDVVMAITQHGGRVMAAPAAGTIRLILPSLEHG